MASPQQKPTPFTTPYSPIRERVKEGVDDYPDASPRGGCSCFHRFCFCFGSNEGSSHNYLLHERGGLHEETWQEATLKKLKQFSEVVAGPKWKNFLRKIGKLCHPKKYDKQTAAQFQYSPESYALNFAGDRNSEEDDTLLQSFSSRFAPHVLVNDHQLRKAGL